MPFIEHRITRTRVTLADPAMPGYEVRGDQALTRPWLAVHDGISIADRRKHRSAAIADCERHHREGKRA